MAAAVGRVDEGDEKGEETDGDGDAVVADTDGVAEGEEGKVISGENIGADAVDGTAL